MSKTPFSDQIAQMDPETDHQQIVRLLNNHIFPWDFERALEFALFRTYAVPSISKLLVETGEFKNRPQKRYDDTELIMYNLSDYGYDSPEGKQALRRMNNMHHRFDISNDDYLYVLSTFIFEPFRWVEKYGRRPLTDKEKEAALIYYQNVGRRMNIKDIPDNLEEFEAFNRAFEANHFVYSDDNRQIGEATVKLFLGFYAPKFLWFLGRPVIYSMMEPELLDAFGFPHPPNWLRIVTDGGLKLRARLLRFVPERKTAVLGSLRPRPTYPEGYKINEIGTFKE